MKYVIGWLRTKPGKRAELLSLLRPFAQQSREEEGVNIFEVNPSDTDSDVVVFIECYEDEEVHIRHLAQEEHVVLLDRIAKIGIGGQFHHIYSDRTEVHKIKFGDENDTVLQSTVPRPH